MKPDPINTPIQYTLKSIQTNRFVFTLPKKEYDQEKAEINYVVSPIVKYQVKHDFILIFIDIKGSIIETKEVLVEIEGVFTFIAKDLESYLELTDDGKAHKFKDERNDALLITLTSISLSTMRGILLERTKGSLMEMYPLPVMNPATFFPNK